MAQVATRVHVRHRQRECSENDAEAVQRGFARSLSREMPKPSHNLGVKYAYGLWRVLKNDAEAVKLVPAGRRAGLTPIAQLQPRSQVRQGQRASSRTMPRP